MAVTIFYDGDCPFCSRYVRLLRLRRAAGPVELVDLRLNPEVRGRLEAQGFDLDKGMVVDAGGRRLAGTDAIHTLALLSTPSDRFNRLNRLVLSFGPIAAAVYPVLRSGRWFTLFLLGRQGIGAIDSGVAARAEIFGCFFALFSIFHVFNYAFEYGRFPPSWDQVAIAATATMLLFNPGSSRALCLVMLASTVSTLVQAPVHSNHTMVRSALLIGYWASFLFVMFRASNRSAVFANLTLAGQGALLVMYVFGIFHKINTDFLDPTTSCAVALWRRMPEPLRWIEGPLIDNATIYGTFAAEGAIMWMLLTPRLRHYGVVAGILFHLLIALSGYAMYVSFTMLSISLHTLFLDGESAKRIVASRGMRVLQIRLFDPAYATIACLLIAGLTLAAFAGNYSLVTLLALPMVLPFCVLVVRYGGPPKPPHAVSRPRNSRPAVVIGAAVTAIFFANCSMPYLGLKSAQAINMFANLRLEDGTSNHLLLSHPPGPFRYLEDIAEIDDSGGDAGLEWYRRNDHSIVYYDLLVRLLNDPELVVSFTRGGRSLESVSAADLADDIARQLHPAWFRKWFHFQPVSLARPEPCGV